jgi:hypothetical protein
MNNNMDNIRKTLNDYNKWVSETFPDGSPQSSLKGLKRKIKELEYELMSNITLENDDDIFFSNERICIEYADCFMYLFDSARRFGLSVDGIFYRLREKLDINKQRKWEKNNDNTYSHVKQKKQLAYICSPITGMDKSECIETFYRAQDRLVSQGFDVINPLMMQGIFDLVSWDNHNPKTHKEYMQECIPDLIMCDIIFTVGDVEKSKGCMIEINLAKSLNITIQKL